MELSNLFVLGNTSELVRFISQHSSSEVDRRKLSMQLLGKGLKDGETVFDISKCEKEEGRKSIPRTMLDTYLKTIGMRIKENNQ
jgi:hypothetical protein